MSDKNDAEKLSEIDSHVTRHYNIIRRLGKGAYGIVWKATEKQSKESVAVKKIFDAFRNQTDAQRTFREIMFLMSFSNHENIIQLIGLHKANNNRDIYLVFEFMNTDLHKVIKKGNILKDIHKVYIMYQLFKAIKYIHSGNVIHRDLKPSNILLNTQCHCKIADFGLARSVYQYRFNDKDSDNMGDPALTDYVATRWYRAPEILMASKRYTKGIDMWSLGCIFGEMLLEKPLFPGSSTINQIERIMTTLPPPTQEDVASISIGYGSNLLEKTPSVSRYSLQEMLINVSGNALNLIGRLIVLNPNYRLTAVEALEHPYVANFHNRAYEPERSSNVIPPLRDDIQLSVEEYRNKLYAMMDYKHQINKNTIKYKFLGKSKSRAGKISDHVTRSTIEPNHVPNIQKDIKKKDLHSNDDIRQQKKVNDYSKHQLRITAGRNTLCQYAHNVLNKNLSHFRSTCTKSCQCFTHYQPQHLHPLNKTQRSIKSDQIIQSELFIKTNIINQPKLRTSTKISKSNKQITGSSFNNNMDDHQLSEAFSNAASSSNFYNKSYGKMPNNITKHFFNSDVNIYQYSIKSRNHVIQNYLNQTMPKSNTIVGKHICY